MFDEWKWKAFGRTVVAGLVAGIVGGAVFEILAPSLGLLKSALIGGVVGLVSAA